MWLTHKRASQVVGKTASFHRSSSRPSGGPLWTTQIKDSLHGNGSLLPGLQGSSDDETVSILSRSWIREEYYL